MLVERMKEIFKEQDLPRGPLWQRLTHVPRIIAYAYASVACREWSKVQEFLNEAMPLVEELKQGGMRIGIMAMKAYAAEQNGHRGIDALHEALSLGQTYGLARTFVDTYPSLADWARRVTEEKWDQREPISQALTPGAIKPPANKKPSLPKAIPAPVLTPKEREILELLARRLTNKEIARVLGVSDGTVKWHMKNVFAKLGAGTRRYVVRRAQILGLLEGDG
jgi:LuxR family maltose regulon positive regulatory protein